MWAGLSCFLSSGDGYVGELQSCSKGVKDPLEVPDVMCDLPRDASAQMGPISPGGDYLLDFLEIGQLLSTYDGDLKDPLWGPQKRPLSSLNLEARPSLVVQWLRLRLPVQGVKV